MQSKTILFLHGFVSSSQGNKARFLREKCAVLPHVDFHAFDFNPTPADFEYMTITGLINRLRQYILDHQLETLYLIASSLGGLIALNYAHRYGGVTKMLLLAPVLRYRPKQLPATILRAWEQSGTRSLQHYAFKKETPLRYAHHPDGLHYIEPVPPAAPATIIHGRNDSLVPIADSRRYATQFAKQVTLIEVDSDHRLRDQLEFIWQQV